MNVSCVLYRTSSTKPHGRLRAGRPRRGFVSTQRSAGPIIWGVGLLLLRESGRSRFVMTLCGRVHCPKGRDLLCVPCTHLWSGGGPSETRPPLDGVWAYMAAIRPLYGRVHCYEEGDHEGDLGWGHTVRDEAGQLQPVPLVREQVTDPVCFVVLPVDLHRVLAYATSQ